MELIVDKFVASVRLGNWIRVLAFIDPIRFLLEDLLRLDWALLTDFYSLGFWLL